MCLVIMEGMENDKLFERNLHKKDISLVQPFSIYFP